jgi:hypothetical protein
MVLLSKAFTGVPPLQLTEQPHFMRLRSNVAWEVMWRYFKMFGSISCVSQAECVKSRKSPTLV